MILSEAQLKFIKLALSYSPETGEFRWTGNLKAEPYYPKKDFRIWHGKTRTKSAGYKSKKRGYRQIKFPWGLMYGHQLAFILMTGEVPICVDHINGDPSDDRWENLRSVTQSINLRNQKRSKKNRSGFSGVHRSKRNTRSPWVVQFKRLDRSVGTKCFACYGAAVAYRKKMNLLHGYGPNFGK